MTPKSPLVRDVGDVARQLTQALEDFLDEPTEPNGQVVNATLIRYQTAFITAIRATLPAAVRTEVCDHRWFLAEETGWYECGRCQTRQAKKPGGFV